MAGKYVIKGNGDITVKNGNEIYTMWQIKKKSCGLVATKTEKKKKKTFVAQTAPFTVFPFFAVGNS